MNKNIILLKSLFCILFFIPFLASAQTRGTLQIIKDPLIDTLIARRPFLGKTLNVPAEGSSYGYRVQIFFGSSRKSAYDAQAKFNQEYPEYRTYISYVEPNFKVHAGDFRTRLEAEKLMRSVTALFPSMFIFSEKINSAKADAAND